MGNIPWPVGYHGHHLRSPQRPAAPQASRALGPCAPADGASAGRAIHLPGDARHDRHAMFFAARSHHVHTSQARRWLCRLCVRAYTQKTSELLPISMRMAPPRAVQKRARPAFGTYSAVWQRLASCPWSILMTASGCKKKTVIWILGGKQHERLLFPVFFYGSITFWRLARQGRRVAQLSNNK